MQYLLFDARASLAPTPVYITLINREIILKAEHDWLSVLIGGGSNNLTQNFELRLLKFLLQLVAPLDNMQYQGPQILHRKVLEKVSESSTEVLELGQRD